MAKVVIDTDELTESENLKLRIYKAKSKLRALNIQSPWSFFKHYYTETDTEEGKERFNMMMNTQKADKEYTEMLESMLEKLKKH